MLGGNEMNVFNVICIVIMLVCFAWSLGMIVFALIKRAIIRKKAKNEVLDDERNENN